MLLRHVAFTVAAAGILLGAEAAPARYLLRAGSAAAERSSSSTRHAATIEPTSRLTLSLAELRSTSARRGAAAAPPSVGSNVDAYGVDSELNGVKLMVEKNTGFALPVHAMAPKPGPCDQKAPCEKELSPLERKIREAEDQVAALAQVRKTEAETLQNRIRREQEKTDAAVEKQLATEEDLSAEEAKARRLKREVAEARLALKKRNELLVDPNRFSDGCAPGFRVYFTGQAKDRMTFDDKKVLGKALKDRHCLEKDLLCKCDMAAKQTAKSSLGKVNAGVDCECFQGLAKEIREQEAAAAVADEQEQALASEGGSTQR
jgi:hypothetical protein